MNLSEINKIIAFLEINPQDDMLMKTISNDRLVNNIYLSPSYHCFLKVELRGELLHAFIRNCSYWLNSYQNHKWLVIRNGNVESLEKILIPEKSLINENDVLYLYTPPQSNKADTARFIELIAHLRSPEGCPWDRKQTHQTLRTNLLEETYEVLESIDQEDSVHLLEELGDLLLQIVLHAQISSEEHSFDFGNVVYDVYWKIRNRHPHVFKDTQVGSVKDVMTNWEKIKADERNGKNIKENTSILGSIPQELPALSTAQKYQERASRVGFDWEDIAPVFEKVMEEIKEIRNAESAEELEQELGDLLFAVVNLVRWSGFDAETCLRITNNKFRQRFQYIEKKVSDNGQLLTDLPLSELDNFWDEAKRNSL